MVRDESITTMPPRLGRLADSPADEAQPLAAKSNSDGTYCIINQPRTSKKTPAPTLMHAVTALADFHVLYAKRLTDKAAAEAWDDAARDAFIAALDKELLCYDEHIRNLYAQYTTNTANLVPVLKGIGTYDALYRKDIFRGHRQPGHLVLRRLPLHGRGHLHPRASIQGPDHQGLLLVLERQHGLRQRRLHVQALVLPMLIGRARLCDLPGQAGLARQDRQQAPALPLPPPESPQHLRQEAKGRRREGGPRKGRQRPLPQGGGAVTAKSGTRLSTSAALHSTGPPSTTWLLLSPRRAALSALHQHQRVESGIRRSLHVARGPARLNL